MLAKEEGPGEGFSVAAGFFGVVFIGFDGEVDGVAEGGVAEEAGVVFGGVGKEGGEVDFAREGDDEAVEAEVEVAEEGFFGDGGVRIGRVAEVAFGEGGEFAEVVEGGGELEGGAVACFCAANGFECEGVVFGDGFAEFFFE